MASAYDKLKGGQIMEETAPQSVSTPRAPAAVGPYSQGIIAGKFVFISGQLPLDPETGDFVKGSIEGKTHRVIKNVKAVLEAAGTDLAHVVKTTVFLINMGDFASVNNIYAQYFSASLPARSAVQVDALPKNADIEMEAIAILP